MVSRVEVLAYSILVRDQGQAHSNQPVGWSSADADWAFSGCHFPRTRRQVRTFVFLHQVSQLRVQRETDQRLQELHVIEAPAVGAAVSTAVIDSPHRHSARTAPKLLQKEQEFGSSRS